MQLYLVNIQRDVSTGARAEGTIITYGPIMPVGLICLHDIHMDNVHGLMEIAKSSTG